MLNRDDMRMMLGVGAIVAAVSAGTCSTNGRIDDIHRRMDDVHRRIDDGHQRMNDGFENLNRRIDEGYENLNRRMNEGFENLNRRIDDLDADVRELRTLVFETVKNDPPAN